MWSQAISSLVERIPELPSELPSALAKARKGNGWDKTGLVNEKETSAVLIIIFAVIIIISIVIVILFIVFIAIIIVVFVYIVIVIIIIIIINSSSSHYSVMTIYIRIDAIYLLKNIVFIVVSTRNDENTRLCYIDSNAEGEGR